MTASFTVTPHPHTHGVCVQAVLLEEHMRELRRVIRPGAKRLNWNSLGINDFVAKCQSVRNRCGLCYEYTRIYRYKDCKVQGYLG